MKFAKTARDKNGNMLTEGDIISYPANTLSIFAVVRTIKQQHRDQFPEIKVTTITADWRGKNIKTRNEMLTVDDYKKCTIIPSAALRDDVPVNQKAKEIQQQVL